MSVNATGDLGGETRCGIVGMVGAVVMGSRRKINGGLGGGVSVEKGKEFLLNLTCQELMIRLEESSMQQ